MPPDLQQLSREVSAAVRTQAGRFRRASLFVKVVLVSFFSAVAAIAQFAQFEPTGPTTWQVVGIVATLIVAIGGVFVIITEQDSSEQLALAHRGLEAARDAEVRFEIIGELEAEMDRLIELFQAMNVMRAGIERLTVSPADDEDEVVARLLKGAERPLAIAMDFDQADQWTIGVYKAVPDKEPNRAILKCVAHKRAIECDVSEARQWKEGTGIMGVAYSSGDEIVVPDLQAEGMRAVFGTSSNESRQYDSERYRSMVAVPIIVHGLAKPWGVVTATNDRVEHFSSAATVGVRPDEGVRALAGMIALAIAVIRKKQAPVP